MRFQYQALERDGQQVRGVIEASSERTAHRDLVRRGVRPIRIGLVAARDGAALRRRRRLNRRDIAAVVKQMQTLVAGGVPVAEAVAALAEAADHPALADAYGELTAALRRGEPFPIAIARCFPQIPAHIHRVIEAGDIAGRLAPALADAAAALEHEAKLRAELRQTLAYPALLVVFGCVAIAFIFLVVVPRFATIFRGKLDQLPFLSHLVIGTGMWVSDNIALTLASIVAIAATVSYALAWRPARVALVEVACRLPFLRNWSAEVDIARWATVLAQLLKNRVLLLQALELARTVLRRNQLRVRLARVESDLRAGANFADALGDSGVLPPTALSLIRVGERSGSLPEMIGSVAEFYNERGRNRSRIALTVIEPVAIILIGAVIGLVAIAIFLAITSINRIPGL
jgi:general secretion pathway protein F